MGKMVRCTEGHFYDTAKHSSCPWCSKPIDLDSPATDAGGGAKTRPLAADPTPTPAAAARAAAPAGGVTKRLDETEVGQRPVVGWLVCIEGPDTGRDYRLHSEKNFIGRDNTMDICLGKDDTISRARHAIITFEPKKRTYWVQPGDSAGLVYVNEDVVHTPIQINANDIVEVGKSKLMLVPFDTTKYRIFA